MRIQPDTPTKTKSAVINERHIHRNPSAELGSERPDEVSTRLVAIVVVEASDRVDTKYLVSIAPGNGISAGLDGPSPIKTPRPREVGRLLEAASLGSIREPSPLPNPEVDIAR